MSKRHKETHLQHLQGMMEVYLVGRATLQDLIGGLIGDKFPEDLSEAECVLIEREIIRLDEQALATHAQTWKAKTDQDSATELLAMFN